MSKLKFPKDNSEAKNRLVEYFTGNGKAPKGNPEDKRIIYLVKKTLIAKHSSDMSGNKSLVITTEKSEDGFHYLIFISSVLNLGIYGDVIRINIEDMKKLRDGLSAEIERREKDEDEKRNTERD